jgi:hypothetical protein
MLSLDMLDFAIRHGSPEGAPGERPQNPVSPHQFADAPQKSGAPAFAEST